MGRTPTPTALKKLRGNPGHRPLASNEPAPAPVVPTCPRHVTGIARREWHRLTRELHAVGLLTQVDRAALAAYCTAYGRWVEAETELAKGGLTVTTPKGFEIASPYVGIANKAIELMGKFASQFGMTPASRSKISLPSPEEDDPFEEYVKQQLDKKK
jgi:P27 family predicted phage terminase small subunit